jgi:hypothetical protein
MNKIRGKVLSLVLAAALVVSSFPATFASASSHKTVSGQLKDDPDQDTFYLVNGGTEKKQLELSGVEDLIYTNGVPLETKDHEEASDVEIASMSHSSGDRVVKWDIDDGNVSLKLRSSSSEGKEVIAVLFKGTYTDDDDNEITVKATKDITVYALDKDSTVIGEADLSDDAVNGKDSAELDSNFVAKTVDHEIKGETGATDSKELTVYKVEPQADSPLPVWTALKTVDKDDETIAGDAIYTIKSSNTKDINLTDSGATKAGFDDQDAGEKTPGLTYSETDGKITVSAPAGTSYTYTYSVNGTDKGEVPATGIPVAGLKGTDKIAITAKDAAGKTYKSDDTTYAAAKEASMVPTTATANVVGLKLDGTDIVVDGCTGHTDYEYVYTTDGKDPTATSDKVPSGNKIDVSKVTKDTTYKVAALGSNGDLVAGSASTGDFKVAVPASCSASATADKAGVKMSTDGSAIMPVAPTSASVSYVYYYTTDGSDPTGDSAKEVTGGVITLTTEEKAKDCTVKVAAYDDDKASTGKLVGTASGKYTAAVSAADATSGVIAEINPQRDKVSTGTVTFTAEPTTYGKEHGNLSTTKDVKVKCKIDKTIKVTADNSEFKNLGKDHGKTYLYSTNRESDVKNADGRVTNRINVSGYEVNFDDCTGMDVTVDDKANVTKVSGKVKSLKVESGNVSKVSLDAGEVSVDDAKTGDIKTKDSGVIISSDASVGNVTAEKDGGSITVNSGKTGDLKAEDGKVELTATDEDYNITVGNVTTKDMSVDSQDSKITIGTIKSTDNSGTFTFAGDNVTMKEFDFDYRDSTLECDDFQGTIPSLKNASKEGTTLSTNDSAADVTIGSDVDIDTISIDDESKVTFNGKVKVEDVDGAGTMVIKAGNLEVGNSASDTILKLSDPTLTKGQTVFTASHDNVDTDDFDSYGFTLAKSEGKNTDTFKIDSLKFAGVSISKASASIAKGYSEQFTAGAYPGGTSLPTGYTIDWDLEDNDGVFELTKNADGSATVKCVDYDKAFADENKATLVAKLIDADGDEDEDYEEAKCDLTALETLPQKFISDTTGNKAMKLGDTYQFAITSTDGTKPSFAVASAGAAVSYAGASGNKYFFKVKAAKVGSYGVYAGGTRVAILVISSDVTLDTSKVTVKAGSSYQFEATAPKQPTFQVAGIGTIALRSHSGSNYYFKVTVPSKTAKGGHGVYVNGVRMAVLTVA